MGLARQTADDDLDELAERPEKRPRTSPQRIVESTELFGRETEVGIAHAGVVYRLRITRQGKLILNK